ncbi:MAG TPA: lipoate--protein ligase [Bacteroidales bacterium]|nr:lipoate--protein ligase [Bacteroidales bacterium]
MYLLISNSSNPRFNLATEEYLLKNSRDNIIFLYRNDPCIVVGKHQNAMGEINYRFVYAHGIPVIRRISGGGTVFHDEGNFNFTFLQNGEEGNLVNFRAFISPVAKFLNELGIEAEIGPRNDILIAGLKVSGNAEHIFKKRTLHHGTLLYSSALANLRNALHIDPAKYTDRAVKSVRSKVTNIKDNLKKDVTSQQFFDSLAEYLLNYYQASPFSLPEDAASVIHDSSNTKYSDWNWNFGYSPNYLFINSFSYNYVNYNVELEVEKGMIMKARIETSGSQPIVNLTETLKGQRHCYEDISATLSHLNNDADFIWSFF